MEELSAVLSRILDAEPYKLILSNPRAGSAFRKIVMNRSGEGFRAEKYTDKQVFHELAANETVMRNLLDAMTCFRQLNAWDGSAVEYQVKISKGGKALFSRKVSGKTPPVQTGHNREKAYIIREGDDIPVLADMGVFTKEGKIVRSMYDKFRQINRFVEMVDDVVPEGKRPLRIIDFGCGKSYLTFVLYHYFTKIKRISVEMTGLDLKDDVIRRCAEAAKKYGYENLKFERGDIRDYSPVGTADPVDMVISLHACDTATDYAIFNAIRWRAETILCVPCCQHQLNGQMDGEKLTLLSRYGIIKERAAAMMTDAVRANLLEACGYKTQVMEFVDLSHTPKNLMIRAVKKPRPAELRHAALAEVCELCSAFSFEPELYTLLCEYGVFS